MNKLWVRLALVFLLVALLAVGVVALTVERITANSFRQYVGQEAGETLSQRLEDYYASTGSWEGVETIFPQQQRSGRGYMHGDPVAEAPHIGMMAERGTNFLLADPDGHILADSQGRNVNRSLSADQWTQAHQLIVGSEIVGLLVVETPASLALTDTQQRFLENVSLSLRLAVGGAVVLAIVAGAIFAWQLTRPLHRLTLAAHEMAKGRIGQEVTLPPSSVREITDLAEAFNQMSQALAAGEELQRRMAADIAHELRTPVSVMRGQLEAMMDGVLPADTEHIAVVYNQILHLSRLVEDLRTLTLAEAGHLPLSVGAVTPGELVEETVQSFLPVAQDTGLALEVKTAPDLPSIQADADRIRQVIANLVTNALRHTSEGGRIIVKVEPVPQAVRFSVTNSGRTLTPEQVQHIFERFWRAEEARERDRGGAGLGLAISRGLVHLHGGQIWIELGEADTTFVFEIPTEPTVIP